MFMLVEFITKQDLEEFRIRLLNDIRTLLPKENMQQKKEWLRSNDVLMMLDISMGTLQNLCTNGILHPTKVGGLNYYKLDEIQKVLLEGATEVKSDR
jgi:hypothetical protein